MVMTAKEYLSQAFKIDKKIDSMMEQSVKLRSMATKTTTLLSDLPGSAAKNPHKLSDVVVKLVEQEEEIHREIDRLVNLRADIYGVIQAITQSRRLPDAWKLGNGKYTASMNAACEM